VHVGTCHGLLGLCGLTRCRPAGPRAHRILGLRYKYYRRLYDDDSPLEDGRDNPLEQPDGPPLATATHRPRHRRRRLRWHR
jgi:hypothetical protein